MFLQVLSHAGLLVRSQGKVLLMDPWLVGSCYWRSWWNYPPVAPELFDGLKPDAIYITHVHWDHFHGLTLKMFPRDTRILIPYERSTRTGRDLRAMGFSNILELPHGTGADLTDGFRLTSYQFSPWGDSAAVVEADGVTLLNANDAKFMGAPLRQILDRHDRFDFAFRSHSSANNRICFRYTDDDSRHEEDPQIYCASFYNFMEKLRPRYAVPFASNHCYLHRDVFAYNSAAQTPMDVMRYVESRGGFSATDLKVMVSGDSWDSESGFRIAETTYFSERNAHVQKYLEQNAAKLEETYAREARTVVRFAEFERFFRKFMAATPSLLLRYFRGMPVVFCALSGDRVACFLVDLAARELREIAEVDLPESSVRIEIPALILKQALAANMFSHAGISKRLIYRCKRKDARYLRRLNTLLAAYEYEVLPIRRLFSWRTLRVFARRWRELLLYAQLAVAMRSRRSNQEIEAQFLKSA